MKKTQYEYDNNMILNTCINLENKERKKLNCIIIIHLYIQWRIFANIKTFINKRGNFENSETL